MLTTVGTTVLFFPVEIFNRGRGYMSLYHNKQSYALYFCQADIIKTIMYL